MPMSCMVGPSGWVSRGDSEWPRPWGRCQRGVKSLEDSRGAAIRMAHAQTHDLRTHRHLSRFPRRADRRRRPDHPGPALAGAASRDRRRRGAMPRRAGRASSYRQFPASRLGARPIARSASRRPAIAPRSSASSSACSRAMRCRGQFAGRSLQLPPRSTSACAWAATISTRSWAISRSASRAQATRFST